MVVVDCHVICFNDSRYECQRLSPLESTDTSTSYTITIAQTLWCCKIYLVYTCKWN